MDGDFTFEIYLSWQKSDRYLEIMVTPKGARWSGPVERTVRKDDASVGLNADGFPVYVRVRSAERIDGVFNTIADKIARKSGLSDGEMDHLCETCTRLMRDVLHSDGGLEFTRGDVENFNLAYA